MYSSSSDDEEKELMDEIQLNQSIGNNTNTIGSSSGNVGSTGAEFINQMEQVFKAIDTEENGIISLTQLRQEIESLTGESIETNPLIGKLLNFLRIVHRTELPKNNDDEEYEEDTTDGDGSFDDDYSSFEDLELNDKKQMEEDNTYIDFQSFLESIANYMDGSDPKQVRDKQLEKLKLPKFKVPIDLLKKYNITPKYLSPLISGSGNNTPDHHSHLNSSPSKPSSSKFNRLFSTKPIVTFEQFNQLITKLNYGKEIPKQRLLMHIHDLPTDKDDCIDANLFLSRFGGLNHPMSPKLTYDGDDDYVNEKKEDQFNINSKSGNNSPPNTTTTNISQWNSKNTQIVDQLQDSYKMLEKEVESYQSELSMLEKSRQIQETTLKKKDQEIDKLRKDARFVEGMRDTNKDLMVQNQNLKNQLQKLTLNEELLRESIDSEKDKIRELSESNVLKEIEVKKLKLLLKTQQNINNKLSMMVTFSDDTLVDDNNNSNINSPNSSGSINFTSKRIKPTIDRAKQVLGRQKSEKFDYDKYSTIHANNNFSIFLKQQQLQQQEKQDKQQLQQIQQHLSSVGGNTSPSPQSLQYEFEQLQQDNNNNNNNNKDDGDGDDDSSEDSSELDSLKKQLSGFDYQLPSEYSTVDTPSTPSHDTTSSPPISQLLAKVSDGPQAVQMMTPLTPPVLSTSVQPSPINNNGSVKSNYIRTSSPSIKSPSSAPMFSTSPSNSTAASLLSPFSLNNSNTGITGTSTIGPNSGSSITNLASSQLIQDQFNVGSIRRLKKSDIIRLHTSEMEEQNESAQLLITEAETALEEFKKNSALELQRLQKLYQEERQRGKMLEKQLNNQLDKNKEMVTGKINDSTTTNSWGGMQNFFSFVTNYLPSTLFCNLSNTS